MGGTPTEDAWCALCRAELAVGDVATWIVRPDCGASVVFTGTTRDHADGRVGVTGLDYEAYEEHVLPRFDAIVGELRSRWPTVGRVALHHRVGHVPVGAPAVVVGVSSPHRAEAFEAARWAIDTLKATVPIWKKEHHAGGSGWGTAAQHLQPVPTDEPAEGRGPPADATSHGG